jgi:hypothetical protein
MLFFVSVFVFPQFVVAAIADGSLAPYPNSVTPASLLFAVSESGRSASELLLLDSLAGYVARRTPRLYRVASADWENPNTTDSYSRWLQELSRLDVTVNASLLSAPFGAIAATVLGSEAASYVRCNWGDASTSAALTLAAASDNCALVASDDATVSALEQAGIPMGSDVRGKTVSDVLLPSVLARLSRRIFVFQDPSKAMFLGELAVFARAATLQFGSDLQAQTAVLQRAEGLGAAFGWGPENSYVSTLNGHGVYVHASDYNKNLAVLSNTVEAVTPIVTRREPAVVSGGSGDPKALVHTVSFVMTDGDNLQWTLGGWSVDSTWFGSAARGAVPVGWTFSPAIALVAPSALDSVMTKCSANDELVAGPSGVGYIFPSTFSTTLLGDFANLTASTMRRGNMRVINVLGQDDSPPVAALVAPLLANEDVDGMLFYSWGDGYSGLRGDCWWIGGKPVVSGRYSLWGSEPTGDQLDVATMIDKIKALPQDPMSPLGYSVIPVHAWSHSYSDIVTVAMALKAAGGFEIVLPSELIRRVKANLGGGGNGTLCSCDTPGAGTAGSNRFSCSDGTAAFCAANEVCFAFRPFSKPDVGAGCRVPGSVTCACDTPGAGTAGHNGYHCTDGSSAFCAANEVCYAKLFDKGSWGSGCRIFR